MTTRYQVDSPGNLGLQMNTPFVVLINTPLSSILHKSGIELRDAVFFGARYIHVDAGATLPCF